MPTFSTNSTRWQIFDSVATLLETAPELQQVRVRRNPQQAVKVPEEDYLVVIRWDTDRISKPGSIKESRVFRLLIGSIARTKQSDRDADAMHQVVRGLVRSHWSSLNLVAKDVKAEEIEVAPDVENLLIQGALVVSVWEIPYVESYPLRRLTP